MKYIFIPIIVVISVLYLLTWFLARRKVINGVVHHRIWNVILFLSFLTNGFLALVLIARINWGWGLRLPFNILYWHVEAGIVMATVAFFHIGWHWRYLLSVIKSPKKDKRI